METTPSFRQKLMVLFGFSKIVVESPLDKYLSGKYTVIRDYAYRNKRKVSGLSYSVYLNEIITPDAFEVDTYRERILLNGDVDRRIRNAGNTVARDIIWTADNNLSESTDYYLYPSEVLTLRKGDCEDHAFLMASLLPEDLGVAWGFWNGGAHAFNVAVMDDDLWVVDTVGDSVVVKLYRTQSEYSINYIVTKDKTYRIDGGVQFGEIAGWR